MQLPECKNNSFRLSNSSIINNLYKNPQLDGLITLGWFLFTVALTTTPDISPLD